MKIDLHCHSYYSNDGISSPEKLIKTALKRGLDGIALTDHNTTQGLERGNRSCKKIKCDIGFRRRNKNKKGR
jgi:predicted metal-dependent phosphoesterase TrpH